MKLESGIIISWYDYTGEVYDWLLENTKGDWSMARLVEGRTIENIVDKPYVIWFEKDEDVDAFRSRWK